MAAPLLAQPSNLTANSYLTAPRAAGINGICSPSNVGAGEPPLSTFAKVFCAFSNRRSASP